MTETAFTLMEMYRPTKTIRWDEITQLPFVKLNVFGDVELKRKTQNKHSLQVDITKVLEQIRVDGIDTRKHHSYEVYLDDTGTFIDRIYIMKNNSKRVLEWILYDVLEISKT